ncbi:MAG: family 20 glycosylhydrolase [Candidatus Zhuqueibacterota bacterium]
MNSHSSTGYNVIPKPAELKPGEGVFRLDPKTRIIVNSSSEPITAIASFLKDKIKAGAGFDPNLEIAAVTPQDDNFIYMTLEKKSTFGQEGYELNVTPRSVILTAGDPAGIFSGVQTLRQLLPPEIERADSVASTIDWIIPCVHISDAPRFTWRGMLLDCGRHFMTKDFVKRTIDLLAYYKMNRFHWHLTEDQGWRIEIKKYPRLTEIGAWRDGEDGTRYGGFYTQDEIRDVVEYARSRFVTVIPEIEMPGHSVAALASYPELSCTGGPFEVETQWGVHKDVYCAGNEAVFAFLEDVLSEVVELFPASYIHIGGDECPKDRWENCPKCQARIKTEGLKDEHELQSYFIQRIEKFLLTKERRIIGWDEILEGGLAPGATVQSWRGVEGAIAAAKSGHDAIVSPTSHAYFDYPITTTDLRRVYSFEPIPPELTEEKSRRHILGGECNVWTERAPQPLVDQKVFPRLLAMSETLWSPAGGKEFREFHGRVRRHYNQLNFMGVDYGAESHPITVIPTLDRAARQFTVAFEPGEQQLIIHYSTDGSVPTLSSPQYTAPLKLNATCLLKAAAFRDGAPYGEAVEKALLFHGALGRTVVLTSPYSYKYTAGGAHALTDGVTGSVDFRDGFWQGFEQDDFEAVVDLGKVSTVTDIKTRFLQNSGSWIFLPTSVEFSISSDGNHFHPVKTFAHSISQKKQDGLIQDFEIAGMNLTGRYVKIYARNVGACPAWHPGADGKAWIFVDEIIINQEQS